MNIYYNNHTVYGMDSLIDRITVELTDKIFFPMEPYVRFGAPACYAAYRHHHLSVIGDDVQYMLETCLKRHKLTDGAYLLSVYGDGSVLLEKAEPHIIGSPVVTYVFSVSVSDSWISIECKLFN